jgi:L,D-peptidoglycan transpeptidase YkuD (ErfK/YbiS/YcfS/YnhG family)
VLLVVAEDWASTTATLHRFSREQPDSAWQTQGHAIQVSLGRAGLAWGIGLHPAPGSGEPVKREGDGCAPAGIFAITALFGAADAGSPLAQSARLPYLCATGDLKCIDDPASRYYNRVVDQRTVDAVDWHSHEEMRRNDERYAIGAVIAHNSACQPEAGSCIFLHVWQAAGVPTAGCTAAALADMTEICQWLDAAAHPLLVQLPAAEYRRFRADWCLP